MGLGSRLSSTRYRIVIFLLLLGLPLASQAALFAPSASAGAPAPSSQNEQEGDIEGHTEQEGGSESGDANAGQVTGTVVNGGSTSVDATNSSRDVDVESGEASGSNTANSFVGQSENSDLAGVPGGNSQDGDNESDLSQAANAASGDAVGGQVIGVVASGDTDIVASNSSEEVDVETGDSFATNDADVIVGLISTVSASLLQINACSNQFGGTGVAILETDCINFADVSVDNTQGSDNSSDLSQGADAASGDGVGGQVIGVVSPGNTSIDATNSSEDVDIETGEASAANDADVVVGLVASTELTDSQINFCGNAIGSEDTLSAGLCNNVLVLDADNEQDGDNSSDLSQAANATTGDGVGGQVIGVVTSGTTDVVAANNSEDVDIETGDSTASNNADVRVGPTAAAIQDGGQINLCGNAIGSELVASFTTCANISVADAENLQNGDNTSDLAQAAEATTGDGVGGQVLGVVSSGNTSIDATNSSEDVDIETGDANSTNDAFVLGIRTDAGNEGVQANICGNQIGSVLSETDPLCANISVADASNTQDGDNESDLSQTATAASGDGVGGQVIGAVTSGTADIVAANTSDDVDIETGDADSSNDAVADVGPVASAGRDGAQVNLCGNQIGLLLSTSDATCVNASIADATTEQTGDNESDLTQSASAITGDGVGGQVIGAVTSGTASIDATNSSQDVDVETGDADSFNNADVVAGPTTTSENAGAQVNICANQLPDGDRADAEATCINLGVASAELAQDGDNSSDLSQAASATTGDGVGGQVIGAVTSGTADIVAANTSEDVDIETGNANSANDAAVVAGPTSAAENVGAQVNVCANQIDPDGGFFGERVEAEAFCLNAAVAVAENEQVGDNESDVAQAADASTGDGVGGQVIGAVSAGDTSIDATNSSQDVDIETGDADAANDADVVVGAIAGAGQDGLQLNFCGNQILAEDDSTTDATCINFSLGLAENEQTGDNASDLTQSANATTGDGVGGSVIGVVTSAGGSADVVAANTSEDVDIETGDSDSSNDADMAVGSNADAANAVTQVNVCANQILVDESDASALCLNAAIGIAGNEQEGDNAADVAQAADATTGDGVGGQVIGAVSAGATSIDATNRSEDVEVETGDADAANDADLVAGLLADGSSDGSPVNVCGNQVGTEEDETSGTCINIDFTVANNELDGGLDSELTQSASASSGDAVAGQVIGSVAPDGGSADIVAANTSRDIDAESGSANQDNSDDEFVGLDSPDLDLALILL